MDVMAVEQDAALIDAVEAGDAVEERRLARAVGPDDARDHALLEGEVQSLDGEQAAEALGGGLDLEQRHQAGLHARVGPRRADAVHRMRRGASPVVPMRDGSRPSGRKRIMSMSTTP